jgi:hypothetical protein
MKANRKITLPVIIILLCALISAGAATTLFADSGTISTVGNTGDFFVTTDSLPNGISGFEISVSLSNPSKAEILNVTTPSWADLSEIGGVIVLGPDKPVSVMSDTVDIKIMKFEINTSPISNLQLAKLKIRGDNNGTTGLNLVIDKISAGNGSPIAALVQNGTIIIGSTPPPVTKGTLVIQSNPPLADVRLDGTYKGLTNLTILNVSAAPHTVRVEKAGYYPREEVITVTAGTTTYVNWTLTPVPPPPVTKGNVSVISTPSGASVKLNGTPKGPTPLLIEEISAGSYTLRLEAAGYYPREEDITVTAGLTTYIDWTLTPIPLPPVTKGNVSVISTPSGASVILNGTPKGPTPLLIKDVTAGGYTLRVAAAGY